MSGLIEQGGEVGAVQVGQVAGAGTEEMLGERGFGEAAEPVFELRQGSVENVLEGEGWERLGGCGRGVPDNVEDDLTVGWVGGVAMLGPTGGLDVHLDIARAGGGVAQLKDGAAEVGAGLAVPEAGVKNQERPAVQGPQRLTAQSLMEPKVLEETFAGDAARRGLVEPWRRGKDGAPTRILTWQENPHLAVASRSSVGQCQVEAHMNRYGQARKCHSARRNSARGFALRWVDGACGKGNQQWHDALRLCRSGWWVLTVTLGAGVLLALQAAEPDVRRDAAVEAVSRVMPAVVNIGTETVVAVQDPFESLLREFWGPYHRRGPATRTQYSLGSGVIIDEAGYLVTNDHVVRRATRVWVRLGDEAGGKEYEAKLVGENSRSDVALLKIEAKAGETFRAVRFAADDDLLLGETVMALGNPFGLGGSVSRGILSSKSRRPQVENGPMGLEDWIQTDAAINPGNSGGPLINLRGELIGLNVAVFREGQGIGFAIPVRRVTEALANISSPEFKQYWFGARIRPGGAGLVVSSLERGSPAERAGLKPGDTIVGVDGRAPRGYIDFAKAISAVGDRRDLALTVQRSDGRHEVALRLVRASSFFNALMIKQKLGMSVQEITADLAEQLGLATDQGLLVAAVDRGSAAEQAGVQRGHIVLALDGEPPGSVTELAKVLYGKPKGEKVGLDLLVQRRRGMLLLTERAVAELTVQ
jgi:S1-C subfamily serine protease